MISKLQIANNLLYKAGIITLLQQLLKTRTLIILAYHRVHPLIPGFMFDDNLISATPDQFEAQMKFLAENNLTVIDFYDLNKLLDAGTMRPGRYVVITFDDGFDDNYRYAFPILKKFGFKAVIYAITGNINKPLPFWFDRIAFYYKQNLIPAEMLPSNYYPKVKFSLEKVLSFLKSAQDHIRVAFVRNLDEKYCGMLDDDRVSRFSRPLTWAQIREMASQGVEIGSHTCSHPAIPMLGTPEATEWEIAHSKSVLEEHLPGRKIISFSYPIGAMNNKAMHLVQKHGYKFAVDYFHSKNLITGGLNPFALHRIHIETFFTFRDYCLSLI